VCVCVCVCVCARARIIRPPTWELGEGLTIPHRKNSVRYLMLHSTSELVGSYKHENELSSSIKGGESLDLLSDY